MGLYYAPIETLEDGITKPVGELPPMIRIPHYDEALQRAVIQTHDLVSTPIPTEWSQVDEALVNADYPGVLGGA